MAFSDFLNLRNIFTSKDKPLDNSNSIKSGNLNNLPEGVIFFDSTGRIIGNDHLGFKHINQKYDNYVTFYDITRNGFGFSPWVYIVVDRIAKGCMGIELRLENLEGDPISNRMRQSSTVRQLQRLLENPQVTLNDFSFQEIIYSVITQYLLTNNGYLVGMPYNTTENVKYSTIFSPLAQNVLPNDNTSTPINFYDINYYNNSHTVNTKDVMHMTLPNPVYDLNEGQAPMDTLRNIWLANNALNASERFIHERKGSNGVIYSDGNRAMMPEDRELMQQQIDNDFNSQGRIGRYTWMPQKVGYIDLAKSFKDLQVTKAKDSHRETIAACYNYPHGLLNDSNILTYNNVKELDKTAFSKAIIPVMDFFLKKLNKWLVAGNYGLQTVKIGYDVSEIPEMQLMNADKTDNDAKKLDMVLKINESLNNGTLDRNSAINSLLLIGFSELKAEELLISTVTQ